MIKNKLWLRCSKTTLETATVFHLSISACTGGRVGGFHKCHILWLVQGRCTSYRNLGRTAQQQIKIYSAIPWLQQAPVQKYYCA